MMFDWIIIVIIFLSLGGIAYIIIGKFSMLSNLDLENIPEEKISRKKKEILGKRIEEKRKVLRAESNKYFQPFVKFWKQSQLRFRIYVGKVERMLRHEQAVLRKAVMNKPSVEDVEKIQQLINEGERCLAENNLEFAEERFIAAIKLDNRAVVAYRGLADTYFAKGSLEEARETYRFVMQFEPDDDSVLAKLGEIAESQGDLEEAIQYLERAVAVNDTLTSRFAHLAELLIRVGQPAVAKEAVRPAIEAEPQNPKYLDLLAEIAILCRDKELAQKTYRDLTLVNPDNQKLPELKERIDTLTYV